jgi:pyridinium-3,5-bisthiocarboxylic acid mononucleotide nickel chelatase
MRTLFLNPVTGIAGDMLVAALLDLGADTPEYWAELARLPLPPASWQAKVERVMRGGMAARHFSVVYRDEADGPWQSESTTSTGGVEPEPLAPVAAGLGKRAKQLLLAPGQDHPHGRRLPEILALINRSPFDPWVKGKASKAFELLAAAEGKVHNQPTAAVHFHEVGAVDAIVDVLAACLACHHLGVTRIVSSPPALGGGTVRCAHGLMPVPVPAVVNLLVGQPSRLGPQLGELTTPTGAALLMALADDISERPQSGTLVATGYGAGTREFADRPNVLQAVLLESQAAAVPEAGTHDEVVVLECNLDDLPGQRLTHLIPQLLAAGALDVASFPCLMKKGRQGFMLQVLAPPAAREALVTLLLRESSSFGVRWHHAERRILARRFLTVATPWGEVRVKLGSMTATSPPLQVAPEYEDCRALAERSGRRFAEVHEAALTAARQQLGWSA